MTVQLYGPTPPTAARVAEYAAPTAPFGSDVVVMRSAGTAIVTVNCPNAFTPAESVTVTDTWNVPSAVGVPVRLLPSRRTPAGSPLALKV